MNLGINVMHILPQRAISLGCKHLEVCLMWQGNREASLLKTLEVLQGIEDETIHAQSEESVKYSIHLPVVFNDYPYSVFSSFFLDEDEGRREAAFELIEINFEALSAYKPAFFVSHFAGIYQSQPGPLAHQRLMAALQRLNDLCQRYNVTLLLEYFGLNPNLCTIEQWSRICEFDHLGILVDTGHLYFSCQIHGFDYKDMLLGFSKIASAFHVWNTHFEAGVYENSTSYTKYHHLVPLGDQTRNAGFAIDMAETMGILKATGKPVIIEASILYGGPLCLETSISEWVTF